MQQSLLFLVLFFCFQISSFSQILLKSQGARIRIGEKTHLHCSGNMELKDSEDSSSKLELLGELVLGGNFLNHSYAKSGEGMAENAGCIRLSCRAKPQFLGGNYELAFQHLILDNPSGLILENDLHLYGNLRLKQGKIFTGEKKLVLHNPNKEALSMAGEENYIVGKLRRYLRSGTTLFPIGSESEHQLLIINFEEEPGLSFIDASFDPQAAILTSDIAIGNARINALLDNGSWTLDSPQPPVHPFSLSLTSRGHSNGNAIEGAHTLLIDKGFGWEVVGELDESESHGAGEEAIKSTRNQILSWGRFSIGRASYALSRDNLSPFEEILISNNGSPLREVSLSFVSDSAGDYELELRDLKGTLLKQMKAFAHPGSNQKSISLNNYPPAVYLLTIRKEELQFTEKIW